MLRSKPPSVKKVIDHLKNNVGINFLALDFDQTILNIHTGGQWKGSLEELFPHIRKVYAELILSALANDMEVAVVTFTHQTKFVRGVLDHIVLSSLGNNMDLPTLEAIGVIGMGNVVDTSHRIPIRGGDRSWRYDGSGSTQGKQPHMASAVEELETRRQEDYHRAKAVAEASQNGTNTGVRTPPPNSKESTRTSTTTNPPSSPTGSTPSTTSVPVPERITRKTTLLLDDDARNIRYALQNGVRAVWFNPKKPYKLLPELMQLE